METVDILVKFISMPLSDEKKCVLGCDKHANCIESRIGYSCACKEGYKGEDATVGSCSPLPGNAVV